MSTPTVYVICGDNCKFEGMTKEQIFTAIVQAVQTGTIGNIDTGFITTVLTINNKPLRFFVGEQSEYDELGDDKKKDLFALITNDTTKEGIIKAIEDLQTNYNLLLEKVNKGVGEICSFDYDYKKGEVLLMPVTVSHNTLYAVIVEYKGTDATLSAEYKGSCASQIYIGERPTKLHNITANATNAAWYSGVMFEGIVAAVKNRFCARITMVEYNGEDVFLFELTGVDGDSLPTNKYTIKLCQTSTLATN